MNRVERWYRVALTAYPPDYLAEREEELVTTLLAATPAGADRPPLRELVSLVRNGVAERSRRFGGATRRQGLAAASHLAIGLFAALTTFVVGPQLAPRWSVPFPPLFLPFWSGLVLLAIAAHALPSRWTRSAVVAVAAVGLWAGPEHVLAWRSAIVGLAALALLTSCRPVTARRWPAIVPAMVGAAVGILGARHQLGPYRDYDPLPFRGAFLGIVQTGFGAQLRWGLVVVLVAVVCAAWSAPRLALTLGLNALPAMLAALSMATPGPDRMDKAFGGVPLVTLGTTAGLLAAGLATASTLRARRHPA